MKLEIIAYGSLLIFLIIFAFLPVDSNNIQKVNFCKIDSIYLVPKYEFTSEKITKYHTECDIIFSSKTNYKIGDSIEVKTIIVQ